MQILDVVQEWIQHISKKSRGLYLSCKIRKYLIYIVMRKIFIEILIMIKFYVLFMWI